MSPNKMLCTPNPNINNSLPLLKLDVQNQNSIPPRQNFGAFHWHYDLQFVLVLKGSITVQTLNHEFIVQKGNGIYINACVVHRVLERKDCHYHSFIFPQNLLPGFSTGFFSKYVLSIINNRNLECIPLANGSNILKELENLDKIDVTSNNSYNEILCVESLFKIWKTLINEHGNFDNYKVSSDKQNHIEEAILFIHENYSINISLADIANAAYISKSTLLRYFKEILHTSPYDYLIDFRIKKATELLKTDLPIGTISTKVGYNSQSQFGKHFRERMNVAPNIYRNIILKAVRN